jgi:hypothetical protein
VYLVCVVGVGTYLYHEALRTLLDRLPAVEEVLDAEADVVGPVVDLIERHILERLDRLQHVLRACARSHQHCTRTHRYIIVPNCNI